MPRAVRRRTVSIRRAGVGTERHERAGDDGIPKRDREGDGGGAVAGEFGQKICVTLDQGGFGDDVEGVPIFRTN